MIDIRIWDKERKDYIPLTLIKGITLEVLEAYKKNPQFQIERLSGMFDRNGKPIFENDVLLVGRYNCFQKAKDGKPVYHIVKWNPERAAFHLVNPNLSAGRGTSAFYSSRPQHIVVGTIHTENLIEDINYDKL